MSANISNLNTRIDGYDHQTWQPVIQAARTESYQGNVTPQLAAVLDDLPSQFVTYVVYNGSYYRWNTTVDEEAPSAQIRMDPVNATSVLTTIADPYDTAPPDVQTAIQTGSVESGSITAGVCQRGETYYAVAPESDTAVLTRILGAGIGYLLTPIGRGFVAVAGGILYYRRRNPLDDRVLTLRRAVAVAAASVPLAFVSTALFESGSLTRFIMGPASAFVVSAGVVAGVLIHQRRWVALIGATVLVVALTLAANVLASGLAGVFFGLLFLFVGLIAGGVTLVYGIVFGRDQAESDRDRRVDHELNH